MENTTYSSMQAGYANLVKAVNTYKQQRSWKRFFHRISLGNGDTLMAMAGPFKECLQEYEERKIMAEMEAKMAAMQAEVDAAAAN